MAQHTIVAVESCGLEMSAVMQVVEAGIALHGGVGLLLMHMQRCEHKHRHEDAQENPGISLTFIPQLYHNAQR